MQDLFRKYLDNQCSPKEVQELLAYFNLPENGVHLRKLITESLEHDDNEDEGEQWVPVTDEVFATLKTQLKPGGSKVVPIFKKTWFRVAAAAIIIGGLAGIALVNTNKQHDTASNNGSTEVPASGNNRALLTLGDGTTVVLETAANGSLTQQGNARISKQADGKLIYKSLNEKPTEVVYNSIVTPRGGQYQLLLSDGSKVWLNAASSLRFPATFTGKERKVTLNGEAYFEVAENATMPFKVEVAGKEEVEVLGTHFNVNAYSDEATLNTTLLKGKVKVTALSTRDSHIIAPGEQTQLNSDDHLIINKGANTEQAVAWKNGSFNFTNADLHTVFRQLSRWYDVDVEFQKQPSSRRFNGEIQRDLKLEQVLKILGKNDVICKLNGKKLVVQ